MTFLNAILAFGAFTAAVPLVIHLLYRSRYRIVDWGAMQFLSQMPSANINRFQWQQWQQWLLLLLRCLIPILLALAMARPFAPSWNAIRGQSPVALAVLLDDSLSMQQERSSGDRCSSYAVKQIKQLIAGLPPGSVTVLVLAGNPPKLLSEQDMQRFLAEGEATDTAPSLDPINAAGELNVPQSVALALDWLGAQTIQQRRIILVSDFQTRDWADGRQDIASVVERIEGQTIVPSFASLNVGIDSTSGKEIEQQNLWVAGITTNHKRLVLGQRVTFQVKIISEFQVSLESVRVRFYIDGRELEEQRVNLNANSQIDLTTQWDVDKQGDALFHATIEADDLLAADNTGYLPLRIIEPVRVLLVDGDRKEGRMESESDFLRNALSPFANLNKNQDAGNRAANIRNDPFSCNVVDPKEWSDTTLREHQIVALCNVPSLDEVQIQSLNNWVAQGGRLVVFPGDQWDLEKWKSIPPLAEGGIRCAEILGREKSTLEETESNLALNVKDSKWGALKDLSRASLDSLSAAVINSHIRYGDIASNSNAQSLCRLSNGGLWVVQEELGKGVVTWFATSCDRGDSNLPLRSAFVPLMQNIFYSISGAKIASQLLAPGQPWEITGIATDSSVDSPAEEGSTSSFGVRLPNGRTATTNVPVWSETRLIGAYEASEAGVQDGPKHFGAVSPYLENQSPVSESHLSVLDREQLQLLETQGPFQIFQTTVELQSHENSLGTGRDLWSWFWGLALTCFFLEMFVARSPMRRKPENRSRTSDIGARL